MSKMINHSLSNIYMIDILQARDGLVIEVETPLKTFLLDTYCSFGRICFRIVPKMQGVVVLIFTLIIHKDM